MERERCGYAGSRLVGDALGYVGDGGLLVVE